MVNKLLERGILTRIKSHEDRRKVIVGISDYAIAEIEQHEDTVFQVLADPLWPKKAEATVAEPIVPCEPTCSLCMNRTMKGRPAYCSQWDKGRRKAFLKRVGEPASSRY